MHTGHPTTPLHGSASLFVFLSSIPSTDFLQSSPSLRLLLLLHLLTGLLASRPALPMHSPGHGQRPPSEIKIRPHRAPPHPPPRVTFHAGETARSLAWHSRLLMTGLCLPLKAHPASPAQAAGHMLLHASQPLHTLHPQPGMTSPIPPTWPPRPSR